MKEFQEIVKIDKYNLDEEWLQQPGHFYAYAEELAEAQKRYDKKKEKLDIIKADLVLDVTKNPEDYGLSKTTQALIDATVETIDEYQKAKSELSDAKYDLNVLQSAVKTLEQRKTALENLVRLHGQNYYSEPSIQTAEQAEHLKEIRKSSARERVKERKRRRKRDL